MATQFGFDNSQRGLRGGFEIMRTDSEPSLQSGDKVRRYEESKLSDKNSTALTLMASHQMKRRLAAAEAQDGGKATPEKLVESSIRFLMMLLRPGWLLDHLDVHSFKVASRTWAHIWIGSLLMAIPRSLEWIGGAAYLTMILSSVDAVGGQSIALAAINSLLLIFVATVAFTAQVICNAINWRLRGQPTLADVAGKIFEAGECAPGDSLCVQAVLLDGRYLSTRTTAVTIFGLFLTTAAILWFEERKQLQAYLRTPAINAIIFIQIALTFSNHVPQFDPWASGKMYLIPVFVVSAFEFVLAIVWFPISSSCNCTNSVWRLHAKLASTATSLNARVSTTALDSSDFDLLANSFTTSFNPPPMFWAVLDINLPLVPFECLYARLDPEDIAEFVTSARRIAACQSAFSFFFHEFADLRNSIIDQPTKEQQQTSTHSLHQRYSSLATGIDSRAGWLRDRLGREYAETGDFEAAYQKNVRSEQVRFESLDEVEAIYRAIVNHHAPLLSAVNDAALVASQWIDDANKFRASALVWPVYHRKRIARQKHFAAAVQDALQQMEHEYRRITRNPHWILGELDRSCGTLDDDQRAYGIMQDVFYESLVLRMFDLVRKTCRWCVYIDTTRPRATLIKPFARVPGGKRAAIAAYYRHIDEELDFEELRLPEKITPFTPMASNAQRRNPNSTPPRNPFHLVGSWVISMQHHLMGDEAIYIYKKSSCALIPLTLYFVRPTLRWAFNYSILWTAVIAAIATSPRAGDCVYTLVVLISMNFFGCLLGLVAWYISAGHGSGNHYGFAGCGAALALILAYTRHFMTLGGILGKTVLALTVALVYSVSYVDGATKSLTALTYGWNVAWIRFVSVIAGLAIGFIVTMLPYAKTIKKTVRVQMAGLLKSSALIQTEIINFALQRYEDETVHQTILKDAIMKYLTRDMQSVSALTLNMASLEYEPPLTGYWPKAHYDLLLLLLSELGYLQASMYYTLDAVNRPSEIIHLLAATGALDTNILAGTYSSAFMCGTSLTTGQALPTITSGHLAQDHRILLRHQFGDNQMLSLIKTLSLQPDGRLLLVSVHTAQLYYRRLDGIMAVIKRLVGEEFGFDAQLNQWITRDHT